MLVPILLVIVGFAALIFGANWLVDGASALAKKYHVSDLVIGLTIVALGTSAPELVVNLIAGIEGYPDIVLGNILGSNNLNLFVILGITGLIMPITVQTTTAWREVPISLMAALVAFVLANDFFLADQTQIGRYDGLIMLICFGGFMYYVFKKVSEDKTVEVKTATLTMPKILLFIGLGLAGLFIGGQLVVENSSMIAAEFGLSDKVIGMTVVAAGTSLPELVTCVVAALKKNSDLAIGNVIGSNIFNLLLILSITGLVSPLSYDLKFNQDFYMLLAGTSFLLLSMLLGKRKTLDRWEAGLLLSAYLVYAGFTLSAEF